MLAVDKSLRLDKALSILSLIVTGFDASASSKSMLSIFQQFCCDHSKGGIVNLRQRPLLYSTVRIMQQLQMMMILALCVSIACLLTTTVDSYSNARITTRSIIYGSLSSFDITMLKIRNTALAAVLRDEKGYEVKPKDWFNGLSLDPGASLTDPRAVPDECRLFAERIKSGDTTTLQETISLLDKHYEYFQVKGGVDVIYH